MKKNIKKVPEVVRGTLIEITERKCSAKMQQHVKVGKYYVVAEARMLTDGTPVAVVQNPDKPGTTMRINANRFLWKRTTFDDIKRKQDEVKFMAEEKIFNKMIKDGMTNEEAVTVVYVPHIVETLAVRYLGRCVNFCKEHMFSEYKAISREVHDIQTNNYHEQVKEIKIEVYKLIEAACDAFQRENADGLKDLHASILRELKKAYPNSLPECTVKNPLRRDAIFGIILLKVLKKCYLDHKNEVQRGVGEMLYIENKRIAGIEKCLNVYAGNIEIFNFESPAIVKGINMIKNRLLTIHFNVVDDSI